MEICSSRSCGFTVNERQKNYGFVDCGQLFLHGFADCGQLFLYGFADCGQLFFKTALRVVVSFFLNGFACCGQLISLAALRFVVSLLLKNRGRLRGLWSARDADKADQMFQSRRHLFFKPAMLIKADHDFQS